MNDLLAKLLTTRRMEYLVINRDFIIQEVSSGVQHFADCSPETIKGNDVRACFPELIGVENYLNAVLQKRQNSFDIKGIGRFSSHKAPLYFDLYVLEKQDNKNVESQLVIFLEEVTERMALEQTLVQASNETALLMNAFSTSQKYISNIIASMADALLVTTKTGNIKKINKAAEELFKYSEQELIDSSITLLIDKEENFCLEILQEYLLFQSEFLKDVEVGCKTKTGEKVYVAFSCSVIQADVEESQQFIYIARDITERQRNQQRLLAQYATARALSESTTIKQAAPKVLRAICESLGWAVGELWLPQENNNKKLKIKNEEDDSTSTKLQCMEIWHGPSVYIPELMVRNWQTALAPGVGLPGRVWASRSTHWISDAVSDAKPTTESTSLQELYGALGLPILSGNEVLGAIALYSGEVKQPDENLMQTLAVIGNQLGQFIQRKQAEAARSQLANQIRLLLESTDEGIYGIDLQGRCTFINKAAAEMLGYKSDEVLGINMHKLIHHSHSDGSPYPVERCHIYQAVRNKDSCRVDSEVFWRRDGTTFPVEYSSRPVFEGGFLQGAVITFVDITERLQAEEALLYQQKQTESLLLNILPEPIANRLKQQPGTIADNFEEVTVLFADIVGFTELSSRRSPTEVVEYLNMIFSEFDQLAENHGLEKIKTIGDAYMVVGGIPKPQANHATAIAQMALDMQAVITEFCNQTGQDLSIRIGINTGPVVAGVIGKKKFIYDLWGDTVNIASRMESHGLPGQIQVTQAAYEYLRQQFLFEERGAIPVKGKGSMNTYFLINRKDDDETIKLK